MYIMIYIGISRYENVLVVSGTITHHSVAFKYHWEAQVPHTLYVKICSETHVTTWIALYMFKKKKNVPISK